MLMIIIICRWTKSSQPGLPPWSSIGWIWSGFGGWGDLCVLSGHKYPLIEKVYVRSGWVQRKEERGVDRRYVCRQFEVSPGRNKQPDDDAGWAEGLLKRPNLLEVESGVPSRDSSGHNGDRKFLWGGSHPSLHPTLHLCPIETMAVPVNHWNQ